MLQKYRYLCSLAKERHFSRAAKSCHVSQPTLSNGLRQLEERLNVKLIERGKKYIGLTPEGEKVLQHAKRMLAEQELLLQSLSNKPADLKTKLRIGAIPTAIPFMSQFVEEVVKIFPKVTYSIETLTANKLAQCLMDFEIDMGLSYIGSDSYPALHCVPVYDEHYFFIAHRNLLKKKFVQITWREAAEYPLCLLAPNMQNRRIADAVFNDVGVNVSPIVESNSLTNLVANVKRGIGAAIIPDQLIEITQGDPHIVALKLVDPIVSHKVGLWTRSGEHSSLLVSEILKQTKAGCFNSLFPAS